MAGRVLKESRYGTDQDRVNLAMQLAAGRTPRESEQKTLLALLNEQRDSFRTRPDDAAKIAQNAAWTDASVAADFAAWVSVCRILLNLHETITKH
jgi:predicted RNA-binding Zn ribbon-like protein